MTPTSSIKEELSLHQDIEALANLTAFNCRFIIEKLPCDITEGAEAQLVGPFDIFSAVSQPDEVKRTLSNLFTEFARTLTEAETSGRAAKEMVARQSRKRETELNWLATHKDRLVALGGKWIVLEGDNLVTYSDDFSLALRDSRRMGVQVPFILYIPYPAEGVALGF